MEWNLTSETTPSSQEELTTILLTNRQIADPDIFFNPPHPNSFSPAQVGIDEREMSKTLQRLSKARDSKEVVVVYGDYDADGICATSVMWEALRFFGITAHPFIPRREHGYGLTELSLSELIRQVQPTLIVTVDNGIVAHEVLSNLKTQGIDVVVTDHHQMDSDSQSKKSPAFSVIHTTSLCGTTVAWMVARSLVPEKSGVLLDLCGIATVTDQVPLTGFNRSFVWHGLQALRESRRLGLIALCEKALIDQKNLDEGQINYGVGPRLNALGRMTHNLDGVRLLCTKSPQRAQQLVTLVDQANIDRKELMGDQLEQSLSEVGSMSEEKILIVASDQYHEGVIGLIASKLTETFHKPSIVLSIGEQYAKASGRSVVGVDITALLRQVQSDLVSVGGHTMAAGFTVEVSKLELVKEKLFTLAREQISTTLLVPSVRIECELPAELITEKTVDNFSRFAPFGAGNRQPIFMVKEAKVLSLRTIGKENKHLKLNVELTDGSRVDCLGWGKGGELDKIRSVKVSDDWLSLKDQALEAKKIGSTAKIDLVCRLEKSTWNGREKIQMVMVGWRGIDTTI